MEVWEGSPSFSGQQNFDGKHQRGPYGPEHDKLEELPNLGPNLRSSPGAHLSGATTPNKGAVGSIGPPFLTKSPQGPDSAPAFKPVGLPGKDSLHVHDLSPLQRSRAAALQQQQQMFPNGGKPHQHQHQHQNLRASVGLEPGGGLTNPGPGPFGRGPSPLEGHLGRGPSPPNPPNGLSRDAMTPPPSLDEMAERMSRMKVSPSQLSPSQLRQLAQLAGGNSPLTGGNNDVNMLAAQMFFLQQQQQQQMHQGMPQQRLQPQPMRSQINQSLQMQNQQQKTKWSQQADMPPKGYKTVICKFWENNMCAKGSACTFAHGADELQRFTGSGLNPASLGSPPSPLKLDRYKTKLCLFHMQSRCSKGAHCPYAHGLQELRAGAPGFPGSLGAGVNPADFFPQLQVAAGSGLPQMSVEQIMLQLLQQSTSPKSMRPPPNWEDAEQQQQNAMLNQHMVSQLQNGNIQPMQQHPSNLPMGSLGTQDDEEPLLFTSVDQDASGLDDQDELNAEQQQMAAVRVCRLCVCAVGHVFQSRVLYSRLVQTQMFFMGQQQSRQQQQQTPRHNALHLQQQHSSPPLMRGPGGPGGTMSSLGMPGMGGPGVQW